MGEPVQKELYASAMRKQQKITYISCGMAAIIYILKDEVVDTSYLHSQHTMFNPSLQ